jgi:uncharacterized protein YkwD
MLSTLFAYAAVVACAANASPAVDSATPATKQAAAQPAKSQPQSQVVYRPQTETPKPAPAQAPAAPPKFEILAIEQSIVNHTNAERARFGLPALAIDPNLMATARQHGTWMATYRQMVHSRIGVAENIAMGQQNTQEVLRSWMNSSGHRANILNRGHRRIGVSAYRTAEGTIYWCQQFMP